MNTLLQCLSHSPLKGRVDPPAETVASIDAVLQTLRRELSAFAPELIFLFSPDHYNGFFLDVMPAFCIGAAAESVGDYGTTPGALRVPGDLATTCAAHLLAHDFDVAVSHRMRVDHGVAQPLEELTGGIDVCNVIPIFVNSVAPPLPSFRRARQLGECVGNYARTLGKRCLFLGSGGLSHNPPVPQLAQAAGAIREFLIAGRDPTPEARASRESRTRDAALAFANGSSTLHPLNPEWDLGFMDRLVRQDWAAIDAYDNATVTVDAGASTHEAKTWVAANAAMRAATAGHYVAEARIYKPVREWIAGFGVMAGCATAGSWE